MSIIPRVPKAILVALATGNKYTVKELSQLVYSSVTHVQRVLKALHLCNEVRIAGWYKSKHNAKAVPIYAAFERGIKDVDKPKPIPHIVRCKRYYERKKCKRLTTDYSSEHRSSLIQEWYSQLADIKREPKSK